MKSKISNVAGFLSSEGDAVIFTKYKGGYTPSSAQLYTKQQIRMNGVQNKIMGLLQPEKELFRFNKSDVQDLQVTYTPGGEIGKYKTSPAVTAVFKVGDVPYTLVWSAKTEEETKEFGKTFGE
jgi:hypothetical protein